MRVFVSEYVCGGAWGDAEAPRSLIREGRAMLHAILEDLCVLPGCRVSTTLDVRHLPLPVNNMEVSWVDGPVAERRFFLELSASADVCLIIAPELENVLHERCELARKSGAARLFNPPSELVALCSDKLALSRYLTEHSIPTIPTALWATDATLEFGQAPLIVKPRFGAGSQDVRLFPSAAAARKEVPYQLTGQSRVVDQLVAQPYMPGTAVSVGVLCHDGGRRAELLPVATQRLSDDCRFRYLGGQVPWVDHRAREVSRVVERACCALAGLAGYVGFDLVVPDAVDASPLLVEINPRLTTSYLGYRALATDNLAARLLTPDATRMPIRWREDSVSFLPDGRILGSRVTDESR